MQLGTGAAPARSARLQRAPVGQQALAAALDEGRRRCRAARPAAWATALVVQGGRLASIRREKAGGRHQVAEAQARGWRGPWSASAPARRWAGPGRRASRWCSLRVTKAWSSTTVTRGMPAGQGGDVRHRDVRPAGAARRAQVQDAGARRGPAGARSRPGRRRSPGPGEARHSITSAPTAVAAERNSAKVGSTTSTASRGRHRARARVQSRSAAPLPTTTASGGTSCRRADRLAQLGGGGIGVAVDGRLPGGGQHRRRRGRRGSR